ncbi:TonB-dependent receptor [Microbulbifer thermotolerans]|uniref:TonB-dependent receptor n=1 Tax=Microbulbifer thermotolerans TaxID=252514 RepID=UPI00224AC71B|nr:TonB-dependent receptor [Microbulbifer thermotolerans]MCX2784069.1 TonB-dependent receptor [Microbulbifer thermotolerans]MCX2835793.1 TonB-dependent receptor [Microbulbifer thermotolerans]
MKNKSQSPMRSAVLLGCCSVATLFNVAIAEEIAAKTKTRPSDALEEVVVTAQKREQSVQDVPVSMQVLSGDVVEELGVDTGFDIVKYLPGFGIDDSNEIRTTTLKTRGIGTFTNSIGLQSSNLVVVDGEVLPRQSMMNLAIADVERVEALRGPQGTLFGQNTSTGVIHYVTKRPDFDSFYGSVKAEVTDFNGRSVSGAINMPINDHWAARVNIQHKEQDGWIRNEYPGGEDVGMEESKGLRGQLAYDDGSNLNVLVRLDYSERDTNCCSMVKAEADPYYGPKPVVRIEGGVVTASAYNEIDSEPGFNDYGEPATARNPISNYGTIENSGLSTEVNYDFDNGISLTYLASYRDFELNNSSGFFTFKFPVHREHFGGNESVEVIQQELRISDFDNDTLNWVLGAFFHDTSGQRSEITDGCVGGGGASSRGVIEDGVMIGCVSNASALAFIDHYESTGVQDRSLLQADRNLSSGDFTADFTNTAIFGQLEYQITDNLDATLGFRALHEKSSASFDALWLRPPVDGTGMETYAEVLAMSKTDPSLVRNDPPGSKFSDSNSDFIYKVVLGYDFSENIRAYVNYSTGYKGPSYFVTSNTNPDEAEYFPTRPEQSTNIEFGLRTRLLDDRLHFNLTYFDMTVEDYQVRASRLIDEASNTIFSGYVNADEVRSTGIEADMVYKLSSDLKLIASYANYKATYEDFADTPVDCPGGSLADRCSSLGGKIVFDQTGLPFPNNAEEQALVTINYNREIGETGWDTNVNMVWRYEGDFSPSANMIAQGIEPNADYDVLDLYIGIGNDKLRGNLFVKNLLDESYTTFKYLDQYGNQALFYPRDYERYFGASVTYMF